jgi:alpha-N-arabinofuranosidase
MKKTWFLLFTCFVAYAGLAQQPVSITIQADKPIAKVPSTMWGIFFEDINFAADGGLYAELVKNRSFEFAQPLMGWTEQKSSKYSLNKASGSALIINNNHQSASNPHFARITINGEGYGLTNEGFRGMGIKKGMQYNFSMMASRQNGGHVKLKIQLTDTVGKILGETSLAPQGTDWKKYTVSFTSTDSNPKAKLNIWFEGKGTMDIDMISLFPSDTWKNRPNGLRADLVQLLADMKPGFIRFPGGCIVEGRELATRYQWKKTVGQPEERTSMINRWNTEFAHRPAPDYYQSFGLGFFEYFQLAEDIGAAPLPILSCGMACQFNTAEVAPMDQLDPYIQDALDLIDFANGDGTTAWSKLRTDMGHAAPFHLTMIGVGNEQWGPQYIERYEAFVKAIKAKYPSIKIVTSNGPFPEGELFEYADKTLRSLNAEIIDEHYYNKPQWFLDNATRYDKYDRKGPKIFAGEYAAQSVATVNPDNKNNWETALAEAAFMTGLERNAEVVNLCSYAPLFAHVDAWQWTPDLIWFDNLKSYATPNYYVQKLFSVNKGSEVIPLLSANAPLTGQQGLYGSAVLNKPSREIVIKLVNAMDSKQSTQINLEGIKKTSAETQITVLRSDKKDAVNSIEQPFVVSPQEHKMSFKGKVLQLLMEPLALYVVRIEYQ